MNCAERIESLFDLLSRNRCRVLNFPFSLPPPHNEQSKEHQGAEQAVVPEPASAGPRSAPAAPFLWGPVAAATLAREELQGGGHVPSETLGENHMPACHGLEETKLLSFLVCVNLKDEKSL